MSRGSGMEGRIDMRVADTVADLVYHLLTAALAHAIAVKGP